MPNFNTVKNLELTIVAPWLSKSDWTGLIFSSIVKEAKEKKIQFNIVIGFHIDNQKKAKVCEPFSFLYPKLKVVEKMVHLANKNRLGNRIVIIDSSFVNIKTIRYLAGPKRYISCFVNGGFFQEHDLDRQTISGYDRELERYEEGHYSLIDKILLPSKYALKIFLNKYPTLRNKTSYHYYPLDIKSNNILKFSSRKGYLYASRKSFEKGFDVISELDSKILKIDFIIGLKNSLFRKKLLKYKALLIPSRADLFGFCALEALLEGVIPVVPKGLSYDELVDIPENLKLSSSINFD